jgi:hypothetical protein
MKIRNLCIVRFDDGKYAVRKGILNYKYLDIEAPVDKLWFCKEDDYFVDCCLTDSLSTARKKLKELKRDTRYKKEEIIEK